MEHSYNGSEMSGVVCIIIASALSLLSVLGLFALKTWKHRTYHKTHIIAYYCSMLLSNVLQSSGSLINIKWVILRGVEPGRLCGWQGGLKQAGNVGTALWSFMIAIHCFNLLFLRLPSTKLGLWLTLIVGWCAMACIVLAGPYIIQTKERGPYFHVSGAWCWISKEYNIERTLLEYMIEFISAGLSLMLYTAVLFRVRGNLTSHEGKWHFRLLPKDQSWQLSIGRDLIDTAMLNVAKQMIWFPIAYTLTVAPIGIARLTEFSGNHVPYALTATAATIFNASGFINVLLLLATMKRMPADTSVLPEFTTPRKDINPNSPTASGITPFTLGTGQRDTTVTLGIPVPRHIRQGSTASSINHSLITRYDSTRTLGARSARSSTFTEYFDEKKEMVVETDTDPARTARPFELSRQASEASNYSVERYVTRPQIAVISR